FWAANGWFRSYILLRSNQPCAFIVGYQYAGRYYLHDMGYDPALSEFSVGKFLQLEVVEDLFSHDRPVLYDLGEYGLHKAEFGNETYDQGKLLLFRRGAYTGF